MHTAKLFVNGRSQAVRLPRGFNFKGTDVFIQKVGDSVILFPKDKVWETFLSGLNRFTDEKNRIALTEFLAPFEILNFDDADAEEFGRLRADLKSKGTIIGAYDMLIAAQALARNLILVTNNTGEFKRITGLKLEDWK
ncbi:MAG: type II toxin-antitoxin system VapB family antitoxin [Candidatus Electronema sp. VV]